MKRYSLGVKCLVFFLAVVTLLGVAVSALGIFMAESQSMYTHDDYEEPPTPPDEPDNPDEPPTKPGRPPVPPEEPSNPDDLVDTGQLNWPVPVFATIGLLLFGTGWAMFNLGNKDEDEETE